MAERRRRRLSETETDDDEDKASIPVSKKEVEESEDGEVTGDSDDEYESVTEDPDDDDDDDDDETEEETEEDEEEETETESEGGDIVVEEDEGWIAEERQSGDGEEQPDTANLDDDEDKKNPAYIPRKGAFYEHDSRSGDTDEKEGKETEEGSKKKLWKEDAIKWDHDRYSDDQQAPKSREEIIALYGYDIRAYDKPPEAPPRRDKERLPPRERRNKMGDYIDNRQSDEQQYRDDNRQYYRKDQNNRGRRGRGSFTNYRGNLNRRFEENEERQQSGGYSNRDWNGDNRQYQNQGNYNNSRNRQYDEQPRSQGFRGRGRGRGRGGGFGGNRSERYDNQSRRENWSDESPEPRRNENFRNRNDNARTRPSPGDSPRVDAERRDARIQEGSEDRRNKPVVNARSRDDRTGEQGEHHGNRADNQENKQVHDVHHQQVSQDRSTPPSVQKHDAQQPRPKRYSSQRQRNVPEPNYPDAGASTPPATMPPVPPPNQQQFYASPPGYAQQRPIFTEATTQNQPPLIRQQIRYHVPPGGVVPQITSPPRAVYAVNPPPAAPMAQAQGMMPPGFIPNPTMLSFPPPVSHYQLAPGVSVPGGPPLPPRVATFNPATSQPLQGPVVQVVAAPPPPVVPPQGPPMQTPVSGVEGVAIGGAIYFKTENPPITPSIPSGTTYYSPEAQGAPPQVRPKKPSGITYYSPDQQAQHPSPSRSPVRRPKAAIPIVKPNPGETPPGGPVMEGELNQQAENLESLHIDENVYDEEDDIGDVENVKIESDIGTGTSENNETESAAEMTDELPENAGSQSSGLVTTVTHEPSPLEVVYKQPEDEYSESKTVESAGDSETMKHTVTAGGDHQDSESNNTESIAIEEE